MNKRFFAAMAFAPIAVLSVLVGGCGSGSGSQPTSQLIIDPLPNTNITRATEGQFSADAKALVIAATTGPWLSAGRAALHDTDLTRIRAQFPVLADIHARVPFTPTELLVSLTSSAPWLSRWQAGILETGDAAVDALLQQYGATGVTTLSGTTFVLHFGQSMNMPALATVLRNSGNANLATVSANLILGDGDRLTFASQTDGSRVYTFSRGFGDCFSGCIARHIWTVTLPADGSTATLVESGAPLPAAP